MPQFAYSAPTAPDAAIARAAGNPAADFIAGGTDMMQLMKENVRRPREIVDINALPFRGIDIDGNGGARIGALERMADVADHREIRRAFPLLSQALLASASPQVRNMATMGGNLLQRTRCPYFRDGFAPCNKREPGSGCSAMDGLNRMNAILGVSDHCIAAHASDFAVALVALDARVRTVGPKGEREIALAELHRLPGDAPHLETVLERGEMIAALVLPPSSPFAAHVHYLKVRDRASFEWALVSAAVALDVDGGTIRQARIAAGGVGTKPWRLPQVEQALAGARIEPAVFRNAAERAVDGARPREHNKFKVELMKRTIVRALSIAGAQA